MSIFSDIKDIRNALAEHKEGSLKLITNDFKNFTSVSVINNVTIPTLKFVENSGKEYVNFGNDNLFPQCLEDIAINSTTMSGIIDIYSTILVGNGLVNDTESDAWNNFMKNSKNDLSINEMLKFIARDLVTHKSFGFEVIEKNKNIDEINYFPTKTIRSGKYIKGKINNYFYNHFWEIPNQQNIKKFPAFDGVIHVPNSILYVHDQQNRYYSIPKWYSAIPWAMSEREYADYQLYNVKNGFKISYVIDIPLQFFKGQENELEDTKKKLEQALNKKASEAKNNNGILVVYSQIGADGKEYHTTITPIQSSQLAEQFKTVNDTAFDKILAANTVPSPLLLGSKTAGQLGGNNELENAVNILINSVLLDYKKQIEIVFNWIAQFYGIKGKITLDTVNPFINTKFVDIIDKYKVDIQFIMTNKGLDFDKTMEYLGLNKYESKI